MVKVLSRQVISGLCSGGHETLLLGHGTLLHGGRSGGLLRGGRTTVAKPEEHDDLANKHTKGTGGQTSQDAKSCGHDDETEDTRDGAMQTTVMEVVWVRVVTRGRGASTPDGRLLARCVEGTKGRRAMVGATVMHGLGVVLAMAALSARQTRAHLQHAGLGSGKQIAHPVEEQSTQAGGLTTALLPRDTTGGSLLDIGLGHVDRALRVVDEGDGNGVHGHGVAIEIQHGESNLDHLEVLLFRRGHRSHLQRIPQRDGDRVLAILFAMLHGGDPTGRRGREDLTTVGQQQAVIDGEVEGLHTLARVRCGIP